MLLLLPSSVTSSGLISEGMLRYFLDRGRSPLAISVKLRQRAHLFEDLGIDWLEGPLRGRRDAVY